MMRVRLLTSGPVDADVRAHAAAIKALPGVAADGPSFVEDSLPMVTAAAARFFRERQRVDLVVTFGEPALRAAKLGWRGPTIHVVTGELSPDETATALAVARRANFRLVTASVATQRLAARTICDPILTRLIRPEPLPAAFAREETRKRLGIAADAPVVFIPGASRRGNTHRLALWATGILAFRDPAFRVIVRGGGNDAMVRRFSRSTQQAKALTIDYTMTDADLALAADVAVFDGEHLTEWTSLAATVSAGTPIVALASLWEQERLEIHLARKVTEAKPRLVALAILRTLERGVRDVKIRLDSSRIDQRNDEWNDLLRDSVATRRAGHFIV